VYLTPHAMKPDTFSQYGYADATNLRALRRGYGHDIYPQYPTTFNMPRVVSGLGAFTRNGYTVDYYAKSGSLSFADKNLKNLYEGMRNADIDFQKNAANILKAISPIFDAIEFASLGKLRADDLRKALRLKLPTWGVALFLEVAAGKRPLDKGFQAAMRECGKDMEGAKAAFGILTAVNGILIGLAVPPLPTAAVLIPILPATATLATVAGTATGVAAILEPIFKGLGTGKMPSRKQMKDMMEGAARLSGQKLPSSAEIDKIAADFDKAQKAAVAATAPPKTEKPTTLDQPSGGNPALAAKQAKMAQLEREQREREQRAAASANAANTLPSAQTAAASGFPVVPALIGVGALAAVILVARKRGKK
jgi:hypothetical protein